MTVSYTHNVATSKHGFGNFGRLLIRWKASIYKLVYPDCLLYMLLYGLISVSYRFGFSKNESQAANFEKVVKYCSDYAGLIPLSFVLAFYVSQVVTRWWNQWMSIPWPDALAATISAHLEGDDERSRLMRRTVMRYVNLTFTQVMVMISPQAKARFPTSDHLVEAGLMLKHEKVIMDHINEKSIYPKYWIPMIWAGTIIKTARKERLIANDIAENTIINLLTAFRSGAGNLLGYDWVCIPLVYTQVVTLAVYLYFMCSVMGKQFIKSSTDLDLYFPLFLFLEFFFYMGWLKVAETMVSPFGEDDDDFEINWIIDRNITVSYLIVDEMHGGYPELKRDIYWDDVIPPDGLPFTKAAEKYMGQTHTGSAEVSHTGIDGEFIPFVGTRNSKKSVNVKKSNVTIRMTVADNASQNISVRSLNEDIKPYAHLLERNLTREKEYPSNPAQPNGDKHGRLDSTKDK